jgi:hypothetical protein
MYQAPNTARIEASFRNYITANPTSFGSTPFDDWDAIAHGLISAVGSGGARVYVRDATAYATEPTEDSWTARVNGEQSPTRTGSGAAVNSGIVRTGVTP